VLNYFRISLCLYSADSEGGAEMDHEPPFIPSPVMLNLQDPAENPTQDDACAEKTSEQGLYPLYNETCSGLN
jgi:hypothetical protein